MLWKKDWPPEAVFGLIAGIVAAWLTGGVAVGLLRQAGVAGFRSDLGAGTVLLATLSFQGTVIIAGTVFLKLHDSSWREVFGEAGWKRSLALACVVLVVATPVMFGLKYISEVVLDKLHPGLDADEMAVQMILGAKPWVRAYLAFFAVVMAPLAEEFFFRGLLFSLCKRFGRPKLGWLGVSFLFALFHLNAPTFLALFVLALGLTWLYETTGGLLAPVLAHSLFNAVNLGLMCLQPA